MFYKQIIVHVYKMRCRVLLSACAIIGSFKLELFMTYAYYCKLGSFISCQFHFQLSWGMTAIVLGDCYFLKSITHSLKKKKISGCVLCAGQYW